MRCPTCAKEFPAGSRSCPACGAGSDDSLTPTRMLAEDAPRAAVRGSAPAGKSSRGAAHTSSTPDSIDDARFIPGTLLAERYRIVGLLGRGGMGEVYRADDLKLGQAVALKFLPEALSTDGAALARFHREVRVARQISHPNVCRVYDIGETEGQHFLSMELVRGEELASVLKRFGRLPTDKAVEVARQLCAGLAAAHRSGVLHRDLKPANVMIDDAGNVRVTDFGLAALAEEIGGDEARAGTPAYMSPEQLAGAELTVKSDIYSLGLVLYELFTGKRAFEAATLAEMLTLRRGDTTPANPSSLVKDLDPLVERVVLRCLEKDPDARPASALQVAASLPGGDPLAAALAAGETPSPEMVAAAPKEGALRPAVAAALLATVLGALALACFFSKDVALYRLTPLEKSPEVLRERAREIIRKAGYAEQPVDTAHGIIPKRDYLEYIAEHDASPARWERLKTERPGAYRFWYRQSPRYLVNYEEVTFERPAQDVSGMAGVYLDAEGRLTYLTAVPPQRDEPQTEHPAPDWSMLFAAAGLDPANFREVQSTWVPQHESDVRAAWDGVSPAHAGHPLHVEAAAFRGRPVYFEVIYPWDHPARQEEEAERASHRALTFIVIAVFMLALVGSALLALRNLRMGRGDRRGAFRLALFIFAALMLVWLFDAHHVWAPLAEFNTFLWHLQPSLFAACFLWLLYVALEPFVRRRWPERIISWTRLLAGDWRDPLVGRDVLIGALFGVGLNLTVDLSYLLPKWLGRPTGTPFMVDGLMLGIRYFTSEFVTQITASLFLAFVLFFLLLLFFTVTRSERLAVAALWLVAAITLGLEINPSDYVGLLFAVVGSLLMVVPLYRYGLLAMVSSMFFHHLIILFPVTSEFSAWYAGDFVLALAVCAALAVYGFYTSLAGQKLFRGEFLQD